MDEIADTLLEADWVAADEGVNEIRGEIPVAVEQLENLDVARTEDDRLAGDLRLFDAVAKLHTWQMTQELKQNNVTNDQPWSWA